MDKTPYQIFPDLSPDEYEALKADIAEHGVLVPVEYDEAGNILDGHHRVRACEELGRTAWPRVTREGMTDVQKRNHVRALNVLRRHLDKEALREQWAAMRTDGMSYRQIAEASGVDPMTVHRGVAFATPEAPARVIGKDGKSYPAQNNRDDEDYEPEHEVITKDSVCKSIAHVSHNSGDNEWYTPAEIVAAARDVLLETKWKSAKSPKSRSRTSTAASI